MAEHDPQPGADERMAGEVGRMFVSAQRTADALVLAAQREAADLLDIARREVQERALAMSSGHGRLDDVGAVSSDRTDAALLRQALDEVEAKLRRSQVEMLTQIAKLGDPGSSAPVGPLSDGAPQSAPMPSPEPAPGPKLARRPEPAPGPEPELVRPEPVPVALNGFVAGARTTDVVQPPAQTLPATGREPVDEAFRRNGSRPHQEMPDASYGRVSDEPPPDPAARTADHDVPPSDLVPPSSEVGSRLATRETHLPSEEAVPSPIASASVSAPVAHQQVTADVGRPAWIANVAVAILVLLVVVAVLALFA